MWVASIIFNLGFLPNKRRGVDNSDTFISLNPSENLNILDEVPYEDIEGLIKELMKR